MNTDFLGCGWSFPVALNRQTGGVSFSAYDKKIKEAIRIIMGTAKGERVMRPDFGCGIHDFMFSVLNSATVTMMKSATKEALIQWEPRIEVLGINVTTERFMDGILDIAIDYRVISTNNEFNLVYPFYLRGGA